MQWPHDDILFLSDLWHFKAVLWDFPSRLITLFIDMNITVLYRDRGDIVMTNGVIYSMNFDREIKS